MTLIALCADKGSPGVTTTALALAAAWRNRVGVVEVDPAGGDLAMRMTDGQGRFDLVDQPNLLTLAAALRRAPTADLLWSHCQATSAGLPVVHGLTSAEQAAGLGWLWPPLAETLANTTGGDVLVDLGRLLPGSPASPVAAAADLVALVGAATTEGMVHLRERAHGLVGMARRVAVVIVASERYGHAAAAAASEMLEHEGLPAPVAGFVAVDTKAVAALQRGERSRRLDMSLLMRSAGEVATKLRAQLADAARTDDGTPVPTRLN